VFVLTAGLMTLLLTIDRLKGYDAFIVSSVILASILALIIYKYIDWALMIAIVGPLIIVLGVEEYFYGSLISLALLLILGILFHLKNWKAAILVLLVSVLGFTCHLFIPIRSAQQPAINENNPSSSLTATINYLERKQYGSQSMIKRMFVRRAEWANQFGNYQRMGFWRFFSEQYGLKESSFVFPFLMGIFGIWEIMRRRAARGVLLLLLVLISSVGLVLYMNFADGTRQDPLTGGDYIEVRDRDYFFTPAFVMFGLCIGLGITTIIYYVADATKQSLASIRRAAISVSSVLLLFPVVTFAKNFHFADRTDNYLAFDYGWNLLQSADENAVLFTNGDNDTFPLWCLQEAYGIRKDVKIVNLSLSNTNWYIKQLNPYLGLKFSLSHDEIDKLQSRRMSDGTIVRIHHQVIDQVINDNFGLIPINFSVTVGSDNRKFGGRSIDSLLALKGFSWRLYPERRNFGVDVEEGYEFFMNPDKFLCRSAANPDVYFDDITERLARNLANGIMVLADSLRRAQDYGRAEHVLMRARTLIPRSEDPLQLLGRIYSEKGEAEKLRALVDTSTYGAKEILLLALGQTYKKMGDDVQIEAALNRALAINPTYRPAFDELMRFYMTKNKFHAMRAGLLRWLQFNPQDQEVRQIYEQMEQMLRGGDTGSGGVE
jgi:hypothetical protein